jgi:hypothetical protein
MVYRQAGSSFFGLTGFAGAESGGVAPGHDRLGNFPEASSIISSPSITAPRWSAVVARI